MASGIDWALIRAKFELGATAYQISKEMGGTPTKQGIAKRAAREEWRKPEGNRTLPIVAEALALDSTRCTDEVLAVVLGLIAEGSTLELACNAAGISARTWQRWTKDEPRLQDLTTRARAGKVSSYLSRIDKAGEKDWKALSWLLSNSPDTRDTFGSKGADNKLEIVINIDRPGVTIDGESVEV